MSAAKNSSDFSGATVIRIFIPGNLTLCWEFIEQRNTELMSQQNDQHQRLDVDGEK